MKVGYIDKAKATYDTLAKRILSRKVILAEILKYTVEEYANCSSEEIAQKYIEGDPTATINTILLDDGLEIRGGHTEFNSPNEKLVTLDVVFEAIAPSTGEPLQIIINVEAQKTDHVNYPIVKRALYYASRLISSQKEKYFSGDDYKKLRKVYSIWVVMDVAQKKADSIQRFKITEELLHGAFHEDIKNYDLLTVILLNLGSGEMSHNLLRLLHLIFLDMLKTEQKEEILLDRYGIRLTRDMREEMKRMGGLMEPAVDMAVKNAVRQAEIVAHKLGLKEGRKEGREEGRNTAILNSIRNLMKNMRLSAAQAMDILEIPESEHSKCLSLLQN